MMSRNVKTIIKTGAVTAAVVATMLCTGSPVLAATVQDRGTLPGVRLVGDPEFATVVDGDQTVYVGCDGYLALSFVINTTDGTKIQVNDADIEYSFTDDQVLQIYNYLVSNNLLSSKDGQRVTVDVDKDKLSGVIRSNVGDIDEGVLINEDGSVNENVIIDYLKDCVKQCVSDDLEIDDPVTVDHVKLSDIETASASSDSDDGGDSDANSFKNSCKEVGAIMAGGMALICFIVWFLSESWGSTSSEDSEATSAGAEPARVDSELANSKEADTKAFDERIDFICELKKCEPKVEDNRIRHQIQKLRRTAENIANYLEENPGKERIVRRYTDIYQPAALNYVAKYMLLQNTTINNKDLMETIAKKAVKTLILLNQAFDDQYIKLCNDQAEDFTIENDTLSDILAGDLGFGASVNDEA